MKIEYGGKPYNCTKCSEVEDSTNLYEIIKYYSCGMVRERNVNSEWRQDQQKRGTGVKKEIKERDTDGKIMLGEKRWYH
jgi:hypothetical protein